MRILLVVVALLFTTAAWTQTPQCPLTGWSPWIYSGSQNINNGGSHALTNPAANLLGRIGEVQFPYTIGSMGETLLEFDDQTWSALTTGATGQAWQELYTGTGGNVNSAGFTTMHVDVYKASTARTALGQLFPAGLVLNMQIVNNLGTGIITHDWQVSGCLYGATAGAAGTYRAGLKIPATTFKR